jgi:hypothetical protein
MTNMMPPQAVSVLRLIRGWSNTDPCGPTALQINSCFVGQRGVARIGLRWLKQHRIVSWADEGSRTRYKEAKVPRRSR